MLTDDLKIAATLFWKMKSNTLFRH
jgi:hypothetical protein